MPVVRPSFHEKPPGVWKPRVFRPGRKNDTSGFYRLYKKINGGMVAPNTHFWGNVCRANVIGRYFPQHTVLPLVGLFNAVVHEPATGKHLRVGTLTLTDNVVLKGLRLVSYLKREA